MSALSARAAITSDAPRPSRAALLALALVCSPSAVASWSGCGGNDAPPPSRPGPGMVVQSNPTTNTSTAQPTPGPEYARNQPYQQPSLSSGQIPPPPPIAAEDKKDQTAPEKKARDYSAELSELLSSTVSCLTGHRADARNALSINVTAQVMPSGSISRADAQGPGLTPVELSCIQKLVSTLRLNTPIEGAPRSVSAHLTLQSQATKQAPQPKADERGDGDEHDRDENPHDSKLKEINNDPPEVQQRDEPIREPAEPAERREPAEPRDQAPHEDTHAE